MARRELPSLPVLTQVVGWACFMLRHVRQTRQLTTAEQHVHSAAWRLSDAIHGSRHD
jgi:hypothetical protein